MKVLITGSGGQLGKDISKAAAGLGDIYALSKEQMNIVDNDAVDAEIYRICPQVVIHTAAYTRVDEAESNQEHALRVNAIGTRNIAAAAAEVGAKLIYISSDYVFDGKKRIPYTEFDQPNPISVYGQSKYYGELFVQSLHQQFFIVRTSWLYGNTGHHFVSKIISAAKQGRELHVVNDEIGSPTYTLDLANFLVSLITTNLYGIYHASNQGYCSRYEFAKAILQIAGLDDVQIHPIPIHQLRLPAERPAYSVMDHQAIRLNGLKDLPPWRDGLTRYLHGELH